MSYISHEIRTPLNIVKTGLIVLREDITKDEPKTQIIDTTVDISSSLEIAIELLSEILSYEKVESNQMALDITTFNIKNFVENTMQPFYLQV